MCYCIKLQKKLPEKGKKPKIYKGYVYVCLLHDFSMEKKKINLCGYYFCGFTSFKCLRRKGCSL